ncbi:MAG: OmpA family protein [Boseongicola sp.]|nr:OmpA family protein [Boseongicola sp.]
MGFSTARAGVFTVQSVTDGGGATPDIMVLADGSGNTITVTSTETDTDCFNITNAGRITMFAGNSAGCFNDSAVPLIFTTNGFELGRVDFADIDDMDGFSSRDSFAASVAGTWTSSQLDVNPIVGALPPWLPATQDQRGRLSAAGGVGNFLARANGNDPLNDSATFVLDTPTTSFIIYMDDVQGSRNARMFFDLAPLTVDVAPTLTLNKTVINDDGGTETAGAWTLTATGPATLSGTTGVSGVVAIGTYTLTETGPSDYTQTGLSCSGAADTDLSDGLTLADAEVVTCTFTNDDDTPANPTLTLLKTVVNDDTGTAVAGDWTLTATGPTTLSGTTGVNGTVSPGTYTLSESGPAGYTQTSLTCSGAADTNLADGLTLATGETVSCTFTNDDVLSSPGLLIALADTPTAQNGFTGGTTPESVLDNDTLNGVAVVPTDVTLTPGTAPSPADGSISMNADGSITVAAGTTAGAYSYDYTICEVLNPTNCSGATATVNVDVSPLNQIESVLTTILSEDLAQTISRQSLTFSGLAGDALDRLMNENGRRCAANVRNLLAQSDINFATGSTEILQSSIPLLDEIAIALASCPDTQFEIAGHTDSRGSDEYNRSLSQGRVETVRAELARRGVPATRLIGVGYGENRPKAENSTPEGLAANRRVEFISLDRFDPSNMATQKCGTIRAFDIDGSLEVGEAGLNSTGTFGEESFDCNTLVRRITKGEFTLTDDDNLGTQGFLSFNIAHEKQFGTSRLNGVFWGGYLSQTDVDTATTGTINGIGINAGLYGARAHDNGLYSNFYAAGGLGLHTFDLNTALSITSEGEYAYLGLFAGAGLSGEIERGDLIIRPKIGFDLGAGFADDAEVTASGLGAIQTGLLELDTAFGVRGYLEASFLTETEGNSNVAGLSRLIALTPSLFCDTGFGTSDPECGLGGNIEYTLNDAASEIDWRVNLGAEVTSSTRSLSIGISRERAVFGDLGTISTLLSGDESGAQVSHSLNLEW